MLLEHQRGRLQAEPHSRRHSGQPFFVSVVTVGELLHAAGRAPTAPARARRSAFVEAVVARFPLLPIDLPTARAHAHLRGELVEVGGRMAPLDLWLAAAALAHGLILVTGDVRDFRRVPGLEVESWLAAGGEGPATGG